MVGKVLLHRRSGTKQTMSSFTFSKKGNATFDSTMEHARATVQFSLFELANQPFEVKIVLQLQVLFQLR
jgi:hypothetical protein